MLLSFFKPLFSDLNRFENKSRYDLYFRLINRF
jgi:hypothetical protein